MAQNNTENVSVGKGVAGGYFFLAPAGTALPSDNDTALSDAFKNMGYLGDDGIVFADSADTENFFDVNGDTIDSNAGSVEKTVEVTFREIKRDTLAVMYGEGNVTDASGVITAYDRGPADGTYVGVFELLLKNGRKWRRVAPMLKPGELGDMTISSTELVGRAVTMNVLKDATVDAYYVDFFDSTETEA